MNFPNTHNRNAYLWWIAGITLSIGLCIFFMLKSAAPNDPVVQGHRSLVLVVCIVVSGLCVIIGTSRRWFGKDL